MEKRSLRLDRITYEDWEAVHTWARVAEVSRYQPWGPNTEEQTREFVRLCVDAWSHQPQERFAYVARADGETVGMGELNIRDRDQRQGELSYIVHPRLWGQGVATAIGREVLSRGFDEVGLHRIYATCDPHNVGSSRVMTKLGMTQEGHLRQTMLIGDGWRDSLVFSILEDEWRTREGA